jgi:uncharacterized membrane protein
MKAKILLLAFYFILSISIIAPIANNHYIPTGDYVAHVSGIINAIKAIKNHQFILRVAPTWDYGWSYPLFQFYSPTPYTVAGIIGALTHLNPWVIFKLCIVIALCLAGLYFYKLILYLTRSKQAAFLSSIIYILAPYLIININVRGDFTEIIAQCLLPLALYVSIKIYEKPSLKSVLKSSIAWYLIATSHLITFVYSAGFYLLLLTIKYIYDRQDIKIILLNYLAVAFAFVLVAWYLVPVLMFHKIMFINQSMVSPMDYNFLTLLPSLLGLSSVSPIPLPASGELTTPLLYPVIGVPIMASAIMTAYIYFNDKKVSTEFPLLVPLLITFVLAVFAVWSPFNFWKIFPSCMVFLQFSYRLLTQVDLLGSILAGYAVSMLFKIMDERQIIAGVLLILALSSCLFHTQSSGSITAKQAANDYPIINQFKDYMVRPETQKDLIISDKINHNCWVNRGIAQCNISISNNKIIVLPLLYYPGMLKVTADDMRIKYYPAMYKGYILTAIKLSAGNYKICAQFMGIEWANYLSFFSWVLAINLLIGIRCLNSNSLTLRR